MNKVFWLLILLFFIKTDIKSQNIQLLGHLYYTDGLSDIWGYTDPNGVEYALVGSRTGPSIVDITTDSTQPAELFKFNKPYSHWWDLKEYNGYAYITNETGGGLFIINLDNLPASVDTASWLGDTVPFTTAHNIFIDENGIGYIFGANTKNGGAIMIDLNIDPMKPQIVGVYDAGYVHDGFVRNDTLWTSEIYLGYFSVVDITVKQNPVVLAIHSTPSKFTHNCWLSDDGKYLFTTDEKPGAFVAAYDVSDLSDIREVGRYRSHSGLDVVPHNTFYINGFLTTSYYRDGVTIADAHRSSNIVQTGWYDTSPYLPAPGFEGCWGVYPYFPSGKMVVSDRQEGLFVMRPHYKRAAYLEGNVKNTLNQPVQDVQIEIINKNVLSHTNLVGSYATGIADSGTFDVRFSHPNCVSKIVTGVDFKPGVVTNLDIVLSCTPVGVPQPEELISFYYNTDNGLTFHYDVPEKENLTFYLTDMEGRTVRSVQLNDAKGSVEVRDELASGIYFATLRSDTFQKTIKVLKTAM